MNSHEIFDIRLAYESLTPYTTANAIAPSRVREGREIRVVCPVHGDDHASMDLDILKQRFYCRACKAGGDAVALVMAVKNLPKNRNGFSEAFSYLRALSPEQIHNTLEIPYGTKSRYSTRNVIKASAKHVFHYTDGEGSLQYDVIRTDGKNADGEDVKDFLQRRKLPEGGAWYDRGEVYMYYGPDGKPYPRSATDSTPVTVSKTYHNGSPRRRPAGPYTFSMVGVQYELYRKPEVLAAAKRHERIHLVEGELKNDAARARTGWCFTTMAGGANADLELRWVYDLAGCPELVVFCDSDRAGLEAAHARARHFRLGVFNVKVVDLYRDGSKRDIHDWIKERAAESDAYIESELEQIIAATEALE